MDESLWKLASYPEFLRARQELLAAEANRRFAELLHGDERWLTEVGRAVARPAVRAVLGGVSGEEEESELLAVNAWVAERGLAPGLLAFDHADAVTGEQIAVFDLAWPDGLQRELSEPVALLLNEHEATIALASAAGFRCFTNAEVLKQYVRAEILCDSSA